MVVLSVHVAEDRKYAYIHI